MWVLRVVSVCIYLLSSCFFLNDTSPTEIYTLSLHDALPISRGVPALPIVGAVIVIERRIDLRRQRIGGQARVPVERRRDALIGGGEGILTDVAAVMGSAGNHG